MRRIKTFFRDVVLRNLKIFFKRLGKRKSLETVEIEVTDFIQLRPNALNLIQLIAIGLGGTIGVGIFNKCGKAAALYAGPSVIISFILGGIVSMLSVLSFAELSSMMATPGSAYTYAYVALGEYIAFCVCWSFIAFYQLAASAVVTIWSHYLIDFIDLISDHNATRYITESPIIWSEAQDKFVVTGQYINLPAIGISILIMIILLIGIRETSITNLIFVILKLVILLIFIFAGCVYVKAINYHPFFPPNEGPLKKFGATGMIHGASFTFFAYNGFESIAPLTNEAKNPARTIPTSMIATLIVTFLFYIGVATVLVGLVHYSELDVSVPFIVAIEATGYGIWLMVLLEIGAMCSLFTVALTMLLAQTRIFYLMSHDGFLPKFMAKVSKKRHTPWVATVMCGTACAVLSGICPIDIIGDGASLSLLLIYIIVHICVIVMRFTHKTGARGFSVPLGPFILPVIGALLCLLLVINNSSGTFIRYAIWMGIGNIYYFAYAYRHSKLGKTNTTAHSNLHLVDLQGSDTYSVSTPVSKRISMPVTEESSTQEVSIDSENLSQNI